MADSAGSMLTSKHIIPYSHFVRFIFIISCCIGCTAVQAPQSYQVPWTYQTNAKVWVFETAPLAARPQPLPSQRFSNSWPFKGGRGIFIAARYDNAPLINNKTFYNELVYVPGRYQPCKSSPDAYFSVARMLVDDLHAQAAGRAVWGYPKEMARFNWTTSGTSTLLRVTQRGKLIFAANFTDAPSREPYLPPWLLSADQRTMQMLFEAVAALLGLMALSQKQQQQQQE
ncbi:hypothetical protein OEZ85_005482 [Tetradesmus obliquus]|uniref:Uncharacterized protein n=1 Tax=Tetradesmus obliquus TaxID=3088 RepID=A0ABY8UI62_TETOB|nr:hypothetical protein OEZ85_005482 [Tetradesmus obliquus]